MKLKLIIPAIIALPLILGFSDTSKSNLQSHLVFLFGLALISILYAILSINPNKRSLTSKFENYYKVPTISRQLFFAIGITSIWSAWIYGVCLGVINGANPLNATFNLSGAYAYILYFILILIKPNKELIEKTITLIGIGYLFYSLYLLIQSLMTGYYTERIISSFNDVRVLYSTSAICVLALLSKSAWKTFINIKTKAAKSKQFLNIFSPLIISISLFIATFSKGYALACAIILLWYVLWNGITTHKFLEINKATFYYIFLTTLFAYLLINSALYELVSNTLSVDHPANTAREIQSKYLMDEFTLFGSGFGVKLKSGFSRDESGFLFELTYHNLIHKLGIISILIFIPIISWLYICLQDSTNVRTKGRRGAFSLGLLSVVFVSYGNPVLFSLQSVIVQCIALYLLSYQETNSHKIKKSHLPSTSTTTTENNTINNNLF